MFKGRIKQQTGGPAGPVTHAASYLTEEKRLDAKGQKVKEMDGFWCFVFYRTAHPQPYRGEHVSIFAYGCVPRHVKGFFLEHHPLLLPPTLCFECTCTVLCRNKGVVSGDLQ